MPTVRPRPSGTTVRRARQRAGALGAAAVAQMEERHEWYRTLAPEQRSAVGLVAQSGIAAFLDWFAGNDAPGAARVDATADVFGTAPRELARSISLARTLDLIRTVVDVVERDVVALAPPGQQAVVREAVLRYSREVAFGAAEVYAQAAETRGAWDARLEALVVDAVLRGEADESMQSRAAALGWGSVTSVAVLVATPPPDPDEPVVPLLHRLLRDSSMSLLASVSAGRLVCILGGVEDPLAAAGVLAGALGDGPVVVGPLVPHLFAAGRSARAALSGYAAAPARAHCPRPVSAQHLLAERALLGDERARSTLVQGVDRPLRDRAGGTLLATATAYLESTGGIEGAARALLVHPNTIRYRLGSITSATGLDLTDPHDAFTARVALALGRVATQPPRPFPRASTARGGR